MWSRKCVPLNAVIVPTTSENTWTKYLQNLPAWLPIERPTVVVSPHPDDETLGAGGLIATQRLRQLPVTLVAVTDGEAAYPNSPELGKTRRGEQAAAAHSLGLEPDAFCSLGLPDSAVASCEATLADLIETYIDRDTLLVAPWPRDPHPDHEACGRAAARAATRKGAMLVSYFFWTWHRLDTDSISGLPLKRLALSSDASARRARALACHHSQLYRTEGEPILPEIFLAPARRPFETYAIHDPHGN